MDLRIQKLKKPKIICCNKYIPSKKKLIYTKKPLGETDFGIKKYYRSYIKCKKCGHYFSNIKFNNITVSNALNDCVDFSSGNYSIENLQLNKCGDKGLSVGEKSLVKLKISTSILLFL